jgi:hypothetical protein
VLRRKEWVQKREEEKVKSGDPDCEKKREDGGARLGEVMICRGDEWWSGLEGAAVVRL